jgi:hypothetical protein
LLRVGISLPSVGFEAARLISISASLVRTSGTRSGSGFSSGVRSLMFNPWTVVEHLLNKCVDLTWVTPLPWVAMGYGAFVGRGRLFGGLRCCRAIFLWHCLARYANPAAGVSLSYVATALARLTGIKPVKGTGARIGSGNQLHGAESLTITSGPALPVSTSATWLPIIEPGTMKPS